MIHSNDPPGWYPGELSLHQFFDPEGNLRLQPCQNNGPVGKASDIRPGRIEFIFDYRRHLTIVRQEGAGELSVIPMIEVKEEVADDKIIWTERTSEIAHSDQITDLNLRILELEQQLQEALEKLAVAKSDLHKYQNARTLRPAPPTEPYPDD